MWGETEGMALTGLQGRRPYLYRGPEAGRAMGGAASRTRIIDASREPKRSLGSLKNGLTTNRRALTGKAFEQGPGKRAIRRLFAELSDLAKFSVHG